jgi:hypothetical protein
MCRCSDAGKDKPYSASFRWKDESTVSYFERDHDQITFTTVYHYHCSILLLVTVNPLLFLVYKLNFIIAIYV